MNAIYRLLDLPDGPLILFGLIISAIGFIGIDVYIVHEVRKRIQQKTDTYDIWVSVVCGSLVEIILIANLVYHLYDLLK